MLKIYFERTEKIYWQNWYQQRWYKNKYHNFAIALPIINIWFMFWFSTNTKYFHVSLFKLF